MPQARFHDIAVVVTKVLETLRLLKAFMEMASQSTLRKELAIVRTIGYGARERIQRTKPVSTAL